MLRKQQLSQLILAEQRAEGKFKPLYRSRPCFQRQKRELIQEILHYHHEELQKMEEREEGSSKYITNVAYLCPKTPRVENHRNKQIQPVKLDNRQGDLREYYATPKDSSSQQSSHHSLPEQQSYEYFNEHIERQKKTKNPVRSQVVDRKLGSIERYETIESFIRSGKEQERVKDDGSRISDNQKQRYQEVQSKIISGKEENESTMILSKFYRSDRSPHRKQRKTENFQLSKSPFKNESSAAKQSNLSSQSPNNVYRISHEAKKPKENEPRNEVKAIKVDLLSSCLKNIARSGEEGLKNSNANFESSSNERSNPTSKESKPQSEVRGVKKVMISLSIPSSEKEKEKSQEIVADMKLNPFDENEEKLENNYDYDQEPNIFDEIKQQKKPIDPNEIKEFFKDTKQVFRVKDVDLFQKEVAAQGQKHHQKKITIPKKVKQQLFTGSQELNYRRYLSKEEESKQKTKKSTEKLSQNSKNLDIQPEKEEKGEIKSPLLSYLSKKISRTSKNNKQPEISEPIRKPNERATNNLSPKRKTKTQDLQQISMKPQQSEAASSSYSFLNQKEEVNENGVKNVNNLVNQSIKAVTENIEKIESHQSKLSQTNPEKEKAVKNTLLSSQSKKSSKQKEPKKMNEVQIKSFMKIFGPLQKQKSEEQHNVSALFFKSDQIDEGDLSHPSTVQKISEDRSQDKSEMIKNLEDLHQNFVEGQLPNREELNDEQLLQGFDFSHSKSNKQSIQKPSKVISCEQQAQFMASSICKQVKIDIDLSQLEQLMLSQDAISFSKFANATLQDQNNSSLLPSSSKSKEANSIELNQPKPSVKRIEIQLDSFPEDQENSDQLEGEADLDELQNYDSDEDQQQFQKQIKTFPDKLPPVIEQQLEETQFHKNTVKLKLSGQLSNIQRKGSIEQQQSSLKNLQDQFLKDLKFQKKNSDVVQYKVDRSSELFKISKSKSRSKSKIIKNESVDYSIDNLLEDKRFQQSESLVEQYPSSEDEKGLIESIKNDISNLKNKIQSSFLSEKSHSKPINFSISNPPKSQTKKLSIDLKNNSSNKKSSLGSISKIFPEHSLTYDKKELNNVSKSNQSSIDFDKLNDQESHHQYYNEFKQQLTNLKRKMQQDAGIQ